MTEQSRSTTVFCIALAGLSAALAVALEIRGASVDGAAVLLLGGLFLLAENESVTLPNNVSWSPSFMLAMAAVVVFRAHGALLGPLYVGMFGGAYLPQIRRRAWRKVLFNAGNFGLSTFATALVYHGFSVGFTGTVGGQILAGIAGALAFAAVNTALIGAIMMLSSHARVGDVVREGWTAGWQIVPFALLGVFLGRLYLEYGAVMVPLFVVPIFIARQTFASFLEFRASHEAAVSILIGALEAKDAYTAGHAERVAKYAHYIGLELNLTPARLERLRFAALMHDVGKLVVPNHLLNKPGRLTPAEFELVRRHEPVSVEILTRIDFLAPVAPSATSEHTHYRPVADEHGQPIEPHIVAVADAYDAMTSTRSYRRALTQQVAFEELRRNAAVQFHPRVVEALISALRRRGEVHGAGHEEDVHAFAVPPPVAGLGSAGLGDLLPESGEVTSR